MQRIYAPVEDPILKKIDKDAEDKGISRAQWVSTAIDSFLHLDEMGGGAKIEEMHRELVQLRTEKEQSWREMRDLKRTDEKTREELTQSQGKAEKLQAQLEQSIKDLVGMKDALAAAKAEADKLSEALRIKDEEIGFLRAHIAQLVQSINQFALKPGEEEIRKKGWWQFWR
jgi:chromosome segregation ATPase